MLEEIVELLTQAGAIGIAIGLILYMWRKDKMYNKTMNNHLEHTIKAQEKVADSNVTLAESLTSLKDVIKSK